MGRPVWFPQPEGLRRVQNIYHLRGLNTMPLEEYLQTLHDSIGLEYMDLTPEINFPKSSDR